MLDEHREEVMELRRKSIYEDQIVEMVVFNSIVKVTDRTLHYQTDEQWCTATWEALTRIKVNTRRKFLQNIPKINGVLRRLNHPEIDKKAMAIMLLHVLDTVMKTKFPHLN